MSNLRAAAQQALEALKSNKRSHYYCEDTWYSCPKHEEGCANEAAGSECDCGADEINKELDAAITSIRAALEQDDKDRVWIEERKAAWAKDKEIARKNAELERERHYTPASCDIAEDGVCEALECCKEQSTKCEEPVAHCNYPHCQSAAGCVGACAKANRPPRREWRGLTDEDIHNLPTYQETREMYQLARAIEATLKEKNA